MDAMRVTGLMSGLDVNSIVDAYMTSAKAPIVKMNQTIEELTFEQDTYNKFIKMITDVKDSMLPLKMESTFKSKITNSSKEEVATAIASINTPPGSYNLHVDQIAEPSYANSKIVKASVVKTGAGVTGMVVAEGSKRDKYDQQEGMHEVTVTPGKDYTGTTNVVIKDTFTANDNTTYTVANGAGKVDQKIVNQWGKLGDIIDNNTSVILINYNNETLQVPVSLDFKKDTPINAVAQSLQKQINVYIDSRKGQSAGNQSVEVTTHVDDNGNFSLAFYDVDKTNKIDIMGMVDEKDVADFIKKPSDFISQNGQPAVNQGNAGTKLAKSLGIMLTSPAVETKTIVDTAVTGKLETVKDKLNDPNGGLFYPNTFQFSEKGAEFGSFKVYQDSSAIPRIDTATTFYGAKFDKIEKGIPGAADKGGTEGKPATKEQIDKWLSEPIGKPTINFFNESIEDLKKLQGDFYINDTKITIEDIEKITPNELMAKVNSSGAGVKMSYDYENNAFRIENNEKGRKELTLGNGKDTSSFFTVFKVGINAGSLYVRGQDKGKLDSSQVIAQMTTPTTPPINGGTFTVNGISIFVDVNRDSIDDILNKVNKSGAGVTMTYDSYTDKFSIKAENGERIKVGGPNDTSTFLETAGLTINTKVESVIGNPSKKAQFTLNGVKYERDTNQVKDIIPGLDFTINGIGGTIFTVQTDTERAVKAVAEWAGKYNELINALNPTEIAYNSSLREQYSEPLTDDKKASMSEDEIKKYQENYEKIAYYDFVSRSSELRTFKTSLRRELTKHVVSSETDFKSLDQIGIFIAGSKEHDTTVTKLGFLLEAATEPEKLEKVLKDDHKFQNMLKEDPNGMYKFFAGIEETVNKNPITGQVEKKTENTGYARVFGDFLDKNSNSSSVMYKKASKNGSIEAEIRTIKKSIDSQTRRVEMYLERLYSEFAAMEQRVGALQQSASYLTGLSNPGAAQK